ncbi:MAG: aminoacetone oxidase family FAD-binding enzyme [bacterium]|nr:aminoacetone oxidase family FAD-binding enzyme [bacterium]
MQRETVWDAVVIGGGPAGMMAAGRAAERKRRVLLFEKNPILGKKLLITGGGRCNLTNCTANVRTMLEKYKKSGKFLFSAFAQFGVRETLKFFHDWGMETKEEAEGRIFPVSNKSKSVLNVLIRYMKKGGVNMRTRAEVIKIVHDKIAEQIIITLADKSKIRARSCIIASGGTSRPETGSTGEGFLWLKSLGHTIVQNDMALVPIALKDEWIKKTAGVTLNNIKLTSFKNGVKQKAYKGKLLFTHVGISGPTVLNMSRDVGELLHEEDETIIMLDLFPALDSSAVREKIQILLSEQSNKKIKNSLSQFIQPALAGPVLFLANIDGETQGHSVRSLERKALVSLLKAIPLHVAGLLGQDKAIISSGGVALAEVNFKTMQSRIVPQLYLAGDALNIDRPSGGYSLQLCWTTGYVAGNSC